MSANDTLNYDVFVSDPIPLNVPGLLPNGEPHMWSPLATTLIYGENDAILAEAPLTIEQGKAVGNWIQASGKKLTHIFATHGHGDHWFAADMLANRFGAQVVASAGTIEEMHLQTSIRGEFYDKFVPGQIPPTPITAVTVPGNHFTLEGHDVYIIEVGHADSDDSAVLYLPDLGLVVAGDAIYNGVHQSLVQSANGGRDDWRHAIDIVKGLEPRWVVASHKDRELNDEAARVIRETRRYLDDADVELERNSSALRFFSAMLQRYPNRRFGATALWAGANALYRVRNGDDVISDRTKAWLTP